MPGKSRTDVIFLHAPSVYDFRKRRSLWGPVSDVVPSTQVFEMYPVGFVSMLAALEKEGHRARIVNIAVRMLRSRRFNVDKFVKRLKAKVFGIDLHWMVHAQGALALAHILKKYHPDTPIVFGGLSSSYFYRELIELPQVDFIVRGDSAEEPMCRLLDAVKNDLPLEEVPNLVWKQDGEARDNGISHVCETLDELSLDYRHIMKSTARHLDLIGHVPFRAWIRYPIVAQLTCRGCVHNCVICGGSRDAYARLCGRARPAYRSPARVVDDMEMASRYIRAPIMILGDIFQPGKAYAHSLLADLKRRKLSNHMAFEFFIPPPSGSCNLIAEAAHNYNIQMSPESHDENIRAAFGRRYSNDALEKLITEALDSGCQRFDVFFMSGLPQQTTSSVMETIDYCEELLQKFDGRVLPFISPLAPFLDPGSIAFEEPEKYGYKLLFSSLEDHRKALLAPSWKHSLNYETEWMSRDELVEVTYEAALKLSGIKEKYGLLSRKEAALIAERTSHERKLIREIDEIYENYTEEYARECAVTEAIGRYETVGGSTICRKDEMQWPMAFIKFNPLNIAKYAFAQRNS